ncbi:hypothetical protein [Saccharothrix xinjiangensis]|uniref:Ricin-type beta-trefoil lectin protein n=1 Tax=Saccharothrix xinjiangensis TaxID=204798 RepID=A0ABV9XYC4_9PSEU
MRVLPTVLTALLVFTPTAAAVERDQGGHQRGDYYQGGHERDEYEQVVVDSVRFPGLALAAGAQSEPVEVEVRTGRPDQRWRFHPDDAGVFTTVVHWQLRGCLTAYSPTRITVLECIGAQGQSWVERSHPGGSFALESALYAGECLTASRPFEAVDVRPCQEGDPRQAWTR